MGVQICFFFGLALNMRSGAHHWRCALLDLLLLMSAAAVSSMTLASQCQEQTSCQGKTIIVFDSPPGTI